MGKGSIAPIAGSPADKAGIQPADTILQINDYPTARLTLDEAAERMHDLGHAADLKRAFALRVDRDIGAKAHVRFDDFFQQRTDWRARDHHVAAFAIGGELRENASAAFALGDEELKIFVAGIVRRSLARHLFRDEMDGGQRRAEFMRSRSGKTAKRRKRLLA